MLWVPRGHKTKQGKPSASPRVKTKNRGQFHHSPLGGQSTLSAVTGTAISGSSSSSVGSVGRSMTSAAAAQRKKSRRRRRLGRPSGGGAAEGRRTLGGDFPRRGGGERSEAAKTVYTTTTTLGYMETTANASACASRDAQVIVESRATRHSRRRRCRRSRCFRCGLSIWRRTIF